LAAPRRETLAATAATIVVPALEGEADTGRLSVKAPINPDVMKLP
jgi:hypothetical protein